MRKILLYGLGRSNLSLFRLLKLTEPQTLIHVCLDDPTQTVPDDVQSHLINRDNLELSQYESCYVVPGVPARHWLYSSGIRLKSEIEYASALLHSVKLIGITGTAGKSSATKMTADYLKYLGHSALPAGNYGIPLSDIAYDMLNGAGRPDFVILELSSFQLHIIREIKLEVAVLLNIEDNHLDWHLDAQEYQTDKLRIFDLLQPDGLGLCCRSLIHRTVPPRIKPWLHGRRGLGISGNSVYWLNESIVNIPDGVKGYEQAFALAAGISRHLQIQRQPSQDFVFTPLPHRMESIGRVQGTLCINDSKSTTPASTIHALQAFSGAKITLILGGKSKGVDMGVFLRQLTDYSQSIQILAMYGDLSILQKDAENLGFSTVAQREFGMMLQELKACQDSWGDILLLSPAMSSLDQFTSFEARGQAFREFIQKICA